jgi:hypothetical protein
MLFIVTGTAVCDPVTSDEVEVRSIFFSVLVLPPRERLNRKRMERERHTFHQDMHLSGVNLIPQFLPREDKKGKHLRGLKRHLPLPLGLSSNEPEEKAQRV